MKLNEATLAQNDAATPVSSTWLSANAGSGKTRVLTDRVARLLLQKVPPQNILCLTYTKAAASEMQNRLFSRLGDWAMKSDGALAEDLQRMGETGIGDPDRLAEARRLFARAIETPGGLRIQTIHSFCASLLRRFPLEAGVSPGFVEMDEHAADRLREEVVDRLAKTDPAALDAVAAYYTGEDFGAITQALVANRDAYSKPASRAEILDWFGVSGELTREGILKSAFIGGEADLIADVAEIAAQSTPFYQKFGTALSAINAKAPTWDDLRALYSEFLFSEDKGGPRSKSANFPQSRHTKAVEAFAPVIDDLHAFMDRVTEAREAEHLLNAVEKTEALLKFAVPFLVLYEEQKRTRALLDFDDLIEKARALVSDNAVAEWVLYRLDGGLDHILVDEAQDTSPAQWHVIECLAREFSAGAGARATDTLRTVFAVGDKKQSIYSFQGADPREFDRMREHFRERMEGASLPFNRRELAFSFRSSQAVLALVETIFRDVPETRMEMDASHRAFHDTLPGRVDLWPLVEKEGDEEDANWYDPVDRVSAAHHEVVLARKIAEGIKAVIGKETIPLPNGTRRPVKAGDFLILVRRRSKLFSEVIRACKALDLPVAGADRLKLGGELAVKDIASLLSFLATPEDDLSLAEVLRSPLFGWSEGDLYNLAQGRGKTYLWTKLRQSGENHAETLAILDDLRGQADFLRPFDLIERILARHDGRRKLIARLGPEAEDGIDTLLSQALSYEQREVPSLTGFLTWLETDEVEVKRQLDNVGDQIRVMTVHGSKGLESPIVILPDCAHRQYRNRDELIELENGMPVWKTGSAVSPRPIREAAEARQELARQEDLRLLYVAITRAETWLITAAAGEAKEPGDSWYATIEAALNLMETSAFQTPVGQGLRYEHLDWNAGAVTTPDTQASLKPDLPEWAALSVATPVTIEPINPSQMGGAKTLPGDGPEFGDAGALDRGTQVHRLLEVLPGLPQEQWDSMANQLVAGDEAALVTQTARQILEDQDLAWLFGEDGLNEVEITANAGTTSIHGTIDRLIVLPDRVIAIDYKTNRIVPSSANDIPDGLLRQLGAYDHALQQIYPDRVIETAILWTETAQYMPVPHEIVRHAWHSYSTS